MQANWIASVIAVAAVIVAGALVLLARAPSDEPSVAASSDEPLTIAISDTPTPSQAGRAPDNDEAAAKVRELEAMSETYRNTTFVIAIRDAGYTCNELLRVSGGLDDSPKWLATCSETLAYTIVVASNGTLHVEPFEQYFDGVGVRPIEHQLPPEPLPQPR
jgi:hypothetical protein